MPYAAGMGTAGDIQGNGPRGPVDDLVLGTVNAPFRREIDATSLARCIASGEAGDWIVHVATFLTEVRTDLILSFTAAHGITDDVLAATYFDLKERTGERNLDLEARLPPQGTTIIPR